MYCTLVLVVDCETKTPLYTSPLDLLWVAKKLNKLHENNLPSDVYFDVLYSKKFEDYGRDAVVAHVSHWLEAIYL